MPAFDRAAYTAMLDHMQQVAPAGRSSLAGRVEGVGLLAGPHIRDEVPADPPARWKALHRITVDTWLPLANVADFPRLRYQADDGELIAAWNALELRGRRPWVVCHSHVTDSAVPSVHDLRMAADRTLRHLVVSLAGPAPVAWLWDLDPFASESSRRMRRVRFQVADLGFHTVGTSDLTRDVSGA